MSQKKSHKSIKTLLPLEQCSLFTSPNCRSNIVSNFKQHKLFKHSHLDPIDTASVGKANIDLNQSSWLQQISYCNQMPVYEPKKIIIHPKEEQKQKLLEVTFLTRNIPKLIQYKKSTLSKQKLNRTFCCPPKKQAPQEEKLAKSIHLQQQQCFVKKMKSLKGTKKSFQMEKWEIFRRLWPKLKHQSFDQSLIKLKSLHLSQLGNPVCLKFDCKIMSKSKIPKRKIAQACQLNRNENNENIPYFLLATLNN